MLKQAPAFRRRKLYTSGSGISKQDNKISQLWAEHKKKQLARKKALKQKRRGRRISSSLSEDITLQQYNLMQEEFQRRVF
jgi:hypothetical protein